MFGINIEYGENMKNKIFAGLVALTLLFTQCLGESYAEEYSEAKQAIRDLYDDYLQAMEFRMLEHRVTEDEEEPDRILRVDVYFHAKARSDDYKRHFLELNRLGVPTVDTKIPRRSWIMPYVKYYEIWQDVQLIKKDGTVYIERCTIYPEQYDGADFKDEYIGNTGPAHLSFKFQRKDAPLIEDITVRKAPVLKVNTPHPCYKLLRGQEFKNFSELVAAEKIACEKMGISPPSAD